jgi:cytochrome P450
MYPEPDSFKPERFLDPNGNFREDPVLTSLYGVGRRVCPGRHLADATLFIAIASLLSVFNIKRGNGTDGEPDIYPFTGGAIRCVYRVTLIA